MLIGLQMRIIAIFLFIMTLSMPNVRAWTRDTLDYTSQVTKYDQDQLVKRLPTLEIIPNFLDDYDGFWYGVQSDISKPWNYYFVSCKSGKQYNLSDRSLIAGALKKRVKESIDEKEIKLKAPGNQLATLARFDYKNKSYWYSPLNGTVDEAPVAKTKGKMPYRPVGEISPDGLWVLVNQGYNMFLQAVADTTIKRQLTFDGQQYYSFNKYSTTTAVPAVSMPTAYWYGQSGLYYALRQDARGVGTLTTLNSLTSPRPKSTSYFYELPGDSIVANQEIYIGSTTDSSFYKIDVSKWHGQKLEIVPVDNYKGKIYFTRMNRAYNEIELCAINVQTRQVEILIHEYTRPFLNEDLFNVKIINGGQDIIWWSDRTGWGHYYHYNAEGRLLNAITEGEWTAGEIVDVNLSNHKVLYYGYGKEAEVHPNYALLYASPMSGGNNTRLTLENADHKIRISPNKKYLISTSSTIQEPPVTVLRTVEGKWLATVYTPDLKALYSYGWLPPEPFTVKAKDDRTDLYGILWKPFNFDPNKTYPIISQVYPGPQTETVWTKFTVIDRYNNTALANMGFIVVCMGHRGGSPYRAASYYKYGHGNLRDYPLEDDKYGLEQLIQRFAFIDRQRVGITGHSGGGMMAFAALTTYPDFYKAAVASAGNHDNRIYNRAWGEKYQGFTGATDSLNKQRSMQFKPDINQDLATNLKGHLLLVVGESDNNVHPASTMRLVQSLIRADKNFDLLVLPGQSHSYEGISKKYYERRQRQFFYDALILNYNKPN